MRIVPDAPKRPNLCAIIPGRGSDPEGFIDTGNDMPAIDPHIYLSITGVREAARFLGIPTAEEYDTLKKEYQDAEAELAAVKSENAMLNEALDGIEALKRTGLFLQKDKPKPLPQGKPKAKAVA